MKKKRLKLKAWEYIFHYDVATLLFSFGVFLLVEGLLFGFYDENYPDWNQPPILKIAIGLISLGF